MNFTLRQVEVFVALAETLHFGRAADSLMVAQATASQELKRLEIALGLRLFDRTTRTATLTPAGEAMLQDARALLETAQQFSTRSLLFREEYLHRARIVASPSVINELIPAVIKRAEQSGSNIAIEEIAADSGAVMDEMLHRNADIGIGRFLTLPPRFVKETIAQEEFYAVIAAAHPLASTDTVDLANAGELPLLLWSREQAPEYYDALLQACTDRGLHPMVLLSPPRIVGSRSYLLREGKAFALVPRSATDALPSEVRALPLTEPVHLPLEMAFRAQDPREVIAQTLALLRATARELNGV